MLMRMPSGPWLGSVPLRGAARAPLRAMPALGQGGSSVTSLAGNPMLSAGLLGSAGVILLSKGQMPSGFPSEAASVIALLLAAGGTANLVYGLTR